MSFEMIDDGAACFPNFIKVNNLAAFIKRQ